MDRGVLDKIYEFGDASFLILVFLPLPYLNYLTFPPLPYVALPDPTLPLPLPDLTSPYLCFLYLPYLALTHFMSVYFASDTPHLTLPHFTLLPLPCPSCPSLHTLPSTFHLLPLSDMLPTCYLFPPVPIPRR